MQEAESSIVTRDLDKVNRFVEFVDEPSIEDDDHNDDESLQIDGKVNSEVPAQAPENQNYHQKEVRKL